MQRKRYLLTAVLGVLVALALGVGPNVAAAHSTSTVTFTLKGVYSCPTSCATSPTFAGHGLLVSHSPTFPTLRFHFTGQVLSTSANGCSPQAEQWTFVTRHRDSKIFLATTTDTICPTANPNVLHETATLTITGGTGRFSDATGGANFATTVLVSPQVGFGPLTLTIRN